MAIKALSGIDTTGTRVTNLSAPVAGSEPATKDSAANADNITSGTLAVSRGGTGAGSYTDGQILVGQTSGNTLSKVSVSGAVSLSNAGAVAVLNVAFQGIKPGSVGSTPGTAGSLGIVAVGATGGDSTLTTTGVGGAGAPMSLTGGEGGVSHGQTSSTGGAGGAVSIVGGIGARQEIGVGTCVGGVGGAVILTGGIGGHVETASATNTTSGDGGAITITAGAGGIVGGGTTLVAGAGGAVSITGGEGGTLTDVGTGGTGGSVSITGGNAGPAAATTPGSVIIIGGTATTIGTGGVGGSVSLSGSNAGGDNTVSRNGGAVTVNGGNAKGSGTGGAVNIYSGVGGVGTGTTGGTGGALNIAAGSGGVGSSTGGTGGQLNLKGGLGGDSTADGAGGDITLQVAATVTLATKLKIVATSGQVQIINSDFKLGTYHTISSAGTSARTLTLPDATTTMVGHDVAQTLTNKRITSRVQSVADAATITPNADSDDAVDITAIAQAFTIANPSGAPTNFQSLRIRIKDNGTARAITWGSGYSAGGVSLPTTTVLSKIMTLGFIYNTANSLNKWQCVALAQEA